LRSRINGNDSCINRHVGTRDMCQLVEGQDEMKLASIAKLTTPCDHINMMSDDWDGVMSNINVEIEPN